MSVHEENPLKADEENHLSERRTSLFKSLGPCRMTDIQKTSATRRLEENSVQGTPQTNINGPCRLWTGYKDGNHGRFDIAERKKMSTHRAAYEIAHNVELRPEIHVLHLCANTLCTNPSHLVIGDAQDNANQKVNAGRSLSGDKHPKAKMCKETVIAIAEAMKKGWKNSQIIAEFKCSKDIVKDIRSGDSWSSVTGIKKKKKYNPSAAKKLDLQIKDADEVQEYVLKNVKKEREGEHEHWLWQLKILSCGYGRGYFAGMQYRAHVLAWRAFNQCRKIPKGKQVLHGCKIKHCVNPHSLRLGTAKENARDKIRDGTHLYGENHPGAKLTKEQVQEIRLLHAKQASQTAIAKTFRVSPQMIHLIVREKNRKYG